MMMRGLYVVFEGGDGSGKSTTMKMVSEILNERCKDLPLKLTCHPGSTTLGAHLRKLVKYPATMTEPWEELIYIDPLSRQLLYMVDTVAFIKQILEPSIRDGVTVLADRSSFISGMVYGLAEGLAVSDVERLFQIVEPPRIDRLYVLRCPWTTGRQRLRARGEDDGKKDHFDSKPDEFFKKIDELYEGLITGPADRTLLVTRSVAPQNIIYIDATLSSQDIANTIATDILAAADDLRVSTGE